MAVLGHFEATIRVNGETAQEYDAENQDEDGSKTTTVVKYIEAISDAEFSYHFSLRRTYESREGLSVQLSVDGHDMGGIFVEEKHTSTMRSAGDWTFENGYMQSKKNGQTWNMPYKFSAIVTGLFLHLF